MMEKPLGCYFQVWSPYYQVTYYNQKTPLPASSRWQFNSENTKKGQASAPITATTSVYLPKPASTDLPIRSDSVLTNAIGKDGVQARLI